MGESYKGNKAGERVEYAGTSRALQKGGSEKLGYNLTREAQKLLAMPRPAIHVQPKGAARAKILRPKGAWHSQGPEGLVVHLM